MADIAKCSGENSQGICPKRETCYRYTAPSSDFWQAYMIAPLVLWRGGFICNEYWNVKDR